MNFGETLAYWYLRLNGFFLIQDFVLHRDPNTIEHSSDTDLLAIRLPKVYEVVGGQIADWDNNKFNQWNIALNTMKVGLIVEVKTGRDDEECRRNITNSFNQDRLEYGIQRLGFWPHDQAASIVNELMTRPKYITPEGDIAIGKLLIAVNMPNGGIPPCLRLNLTDVESFILARFDNDNYRRQKNSDRLRFPSDLMQYLIWSQRVN